MAAADNADTAWWVAPKIGPYSVVGAHTDAGISGFTRVILDTNVAIDLEQFYFGRTATVSAGKGCIICCPLPAAVASRSRSGH